MPARFTCAAAREDGGLHPPVDNSSTDELSPLASTFGPAADKVVFPSMISGDSQKLVGDGNDGAFSFVPISRDSTSSPTMPTPSSPPTTLGLVTAAPPPTPRGRHGKKPDSNTPLAFAWTLKASETLLRVRFVAMKHRFQGTRSSKQLAAACSLVAAETFRLGGLQVNTGQCKSKLKHMHKQYTAYRVALLDTGNATEKQLKEPMCYETMCDVWSDHYGMDADPFFSSRYLTETDDAVIEESPSSGGWRQHAGKRTRDKTETAEGMKAIGEGLHSIAEAFKVSRTQGGDNHSRELLSSIRELSETVQAQTQALKSLMDLIRASVPKNAASNNSSTCAD
ncbi:hypothetical protein GN958_ATG08388 [Phytophthora infestans]|uniref:Uncharacterized protein n=1 Tax=Phytophthora infestans TaxID=4787 RepID=A0A8S9USC3_PHYIN|nr:hypothetical protein GN958_ATG08388 [Phytophthora infestans]